MKIKLHSPYFLSLFACLGFALAPVGCGGKEPSDTGDDTDTGTGGDGDGDTGDGDGDTGDGDGDTGDGDGDTGDGDGDPDTGDGDGDGSEECVPGTGMGGPGAVCTNDDECASCNCYLVPLLGGQCGECNEDADCAETTMGGCTPPNPFMNNGSTCNMGEAGGGCESDEVCQDGLSCGIVLDVLGIIQISTCGECMSDDECTDQICAPVVDVMAFNGQNTCIDANSLPQNSFCQLEGNGDEACESGICSTIDIMGFAEVGACGECNTNDDCEPGQTCEPGEFNIDEGMLVGSACI